MFAVQQLIHKQVSYYINTILNIHKNMLHHLFLQDQMECKEQNQQYYYRVILKVYKKLNQYYKQLVQKYLNLDKTLELLMLQKFVGIFLLLLV